MAAFSGILIYVIAFTVFYSCFEGFMFLRALCRVLAGRSGDAGIKTSQKILLWLFLFLSILSAFLHLNSRFSSGLPRGLFPLAFSYWGLFMFVPFFILADALDFGGFIYRKAHLRRAGKRSAGAAGGALYSLVVRSSAVLLAAVTIGMGTVAARFPLITRYNVSVEKPLPGGGFRVILISDLHIGALVHKKQLARIVSKINALEGDLVLIAGDILDRGFDVYKNENLHEEFSGIKSVWGVYGVPGNHDYFGGSVTGLKESLEAAGVKLLVDETVLIENAFYVIGRNDASRSARRRPLKDLMSKLDTSLPLIVMDHQPVNQGEAEAAGVDLLVSGHTHRGQIWPISLATKRIYGHDYGLLHRGKTAVIVTSGCGVWGPPLRIGTKSEIVCIDLKGTGN